MDENGLIWRKARASAAENGCVEVATTGDRVLVRDTKRREAGHLTVTPDAFAAFLSDTKADPVRRTLRDQ